MKLFKRNTKETLNTPIEKVYCKNCKYYYEHGYVSRTECISINNKKQMDSFYNVSEVQVSTPREINKDNNCPWFEKKEPVKIEEIKPQFKTEITITLFFTDPQNLPEGVGVLKAVYIVGIDYNITRHLGFFYLNYHDESAEKQITIKEDNISAWIIETKRIQIETTSEV